MSTPLSRCATLTVLTGLLSLACAGPPEAPPAPGPSVEEPPPSVPTPPDPPLDAISAEGTHCTEGETAWLSCTSTKSRVLSLCSTTPFGPEDPLFYRFGPLGAPELTYPESPVPFSDAFGWDTREVWYGPSGPPPLQESELSFSREQVTYSLRMSEGQDITLQINVAKGGEVLATLPCSDGLRGTLAVLGRAAL